MRVSGDCVNTAIPKKGNENLLLQGCKECSCALQDHRLKEVGAFAC